MCDAHIYFRAASNYKLAMPDTDPEQETPQSTSDEKIDELNAWGKDQEKHRYYYDDAHGYEKYDPDADNEDEERGTAGDA